MNVIVVGCGPAGLAAAHAAYGLSANVKIIAPKEMTPQRGPLLMQRPIPGINTGHPDATIYQIVIGGSILDYRYKLYGDINIGINGDQLRPFYHAWNHRNTYEMLWGLYHHLIEDRALSKTEMMGLPHQADLVISTANARAMCFGDHNFTWKDVAVTPQCSFPNQRDNTLIFNAFPDQPWVRSSRVFGVPVTEWPLTHAPIAARTIHKPISTDCNCYPKILRTGRFGAWKNEVWVDTAYWDTYNALQHMRDGDEIRRIGEFQFE